MEIEAVKTAYARWAPIYDKTFGAITNSGRRRAVEYVNEHAANVLEVGVGTGLSLQHYKSEIAITGIDASEEMLGKALTKIEKLGITNVKSLNQMDARNLDFPDNHFDAVVAMHIVSVVPEPERVVAEMARVCKPGGQVLITNHFARQDGALSILERLTAPFANILGWHSDFEIDRVLYKKTLTIRQRDKLPPIGMMTFLLLEKSATI